MKRQVRILQRANKDIRPCDTVPNRSPGRCRYARRPIRHVDNPEELKTIFQADREAHLYGLADLEEPFWSNSTWFRDGPAVVGVVSGGGAWETVYAMSRDTPEATLELLGEVHEQVPPGTWVTGPPGLSETTSGLRNCRAIGLHWRMILDDLNGIDGSERAVLLTDGDTEAAHDLYSSDEGRAFFLPKMLSGNPFVGIWEDGRLVAAAGTHVASKRYGVTAVGAVITRPSHRGRGLGTAATAALCERLVDDYETIGLNVAASNGAALRIYERLGFRRVFQYEEIELL